MTPGNEGNAKFNFLKASDPYNAYYQHRISEIAAAPPAAEPAAGPVATSSDGAAAPADARGHPARDVGASRSGG
jgi:splicing factor 3A subunit 1